MIPLRIGASAGAIAIACLFAHSHAEAHAICGSRVFPATLAIDDPGVSDELALPTMTFYPRNSSGPQEIDASFSYTKTIFPDLGLSIGDGKTWLSPGGSGWGNLDTELKYNFFCVEQSEFMGSIGIDTTWASTGSRTFSDPFNTYRPVLDVGKGFGDLPTSLNALRPFAVTGEASVSIPGASSTQGSDNPTVFNWGFTVQYSLPYMSANIREMPEFLKHLVPITEFAFQTPFSNIQPGPGNQETTGTIQPGVIYMADSWQIAVEALIPINHASGHSVGVEAELHFFLDDMFPNSFLGKPIFGGHS
jgi:hypothetical protein